MNKIINKDQVWSLKLYVYYLFYQTMQLILYCCNAQTNKKWVTKTGVLIVGQIIITKENDIIV